MKRAKGLPVDHDAEPEQERASSRRCTSGGMPVDDVQSVASQSELSVAPLGPETTLRMRKMAKSYRFSLTSRSRRI